MEVKKHNELLDNTVGKFRNFVLSGVILHVYAVYHAISNINFIKYINTNVEYYQRTKNLLNTYKIITLMNVFFLIY